MPRWSASHPLPRPAGIARSWCRTSARRRGQTVRGAGVVLLVLNDRLEVGPENEGRAIDQDHPSSAPTGLSVALGSRRSSVEQQRRTETPETGRPMHRAFSPVRDIAPALGYAAGPRLSRPRRSAEAVAPASIRRHVTASKARSGAEQCLSRAERQAPCALVHRTSQTRLWRNPLNCHTFRSLK